MANSLNVGLNTGDGVSYFAADNPFKNLILNSEMAVKTNAVVSGVTWGRLTYTPSSFPNDVSSPSRLWVSVSSDENGYPTSLPYGNVEFRCFELDSTAGSAAYGYASAALPPSSTDDPNAAVFHVMYDGQGENGQRGWRLLYQDTSGGVARSAYADVTQVSAGEYKVSGMDTNTLRTLKFILDNTDPNDHIRNVRIVHQDYRDNFESEPFLPVHIDHYQSITTSGGPIRMMKWAYTNDGHFGILSSVAGQSFDQSSTLVPRNVGQGSKIGMSYHWQVDYANAVDRDIWVNIHYMSDDATVSAIASIIQSNLNSDKKVYVELGNEWWNTAPAYRPQYLEFASRAEALGGSSIYNLEFYGGAVPQDYEMGQAYGVQRSIEIFNIFSNYFSSDRLVRVVAGQLVAPSRNNGMLVFSSAYNYIDALAVNPYVGSVLGNVVAAASAVRDEQWNSDDLFQFMYDGISSTANDIPVGSNAAGVAIRRWVTETYDMLQASAEFSGIELIGYEGGQHLDIAAAGTITNAADREYLHDLFSNSRYDSRWSHWNEFLCSSLFDYGMTTYAHFAAVGWRVPYELESRHWNWFGVSPYLGAQTPEKTGLEAYVAAAASEPPAPANTLEVGLNTGFIGFYNPNNPFKDLIKGAPYPYFQNISFSDSESLSGVLGTQTYSRVYFMPSSFPHNVSSPSPSYLYISEYSDEYGWPTSAPSFDLNLENWQRRIHYTCVNVLPAGALSGVLPPSSTDNPNEATFHVLWDGAGTFNGSRTWYVNYQYDNDENTNAQATIVDVSAGEAKLTGLDTTRLSKLQLVVEGYLIDPSDHMRNIRLVHQDYRDNFESEPFYPLMVDYYKGMTTSGGAVRNMKWAKTNESVFGVMTSVSGDTFDLSSTIVRDFMTQGGELGMAYTTQAQFANAIERDLWINIQYMSDDATVSAIASGVAATLNSNRKIYVELGNEWWNSAPPYGVQRIHFTEQAQANGGSSVYWLPEWNDEADNLRWPASEYIQGQAYAVQRSIDIFNIFDNYFSSDRLVKTLAGQGVVSERNKGMLLFSGAYNHVDMLTVNPYVGSELANLSGAASAVAASAWSVDDLFNFMYDAVSSTEPIQIGTESTQPIRMFVQDNYDMLQGRSELSGIKLGGYEGGQHINVNQSSRYSPDRQDDRDYMISLITSSQYDSRWSDWYQYFCSSLEDIGVSHYVHFADMGNWSPSDTDGTWEWFGTIPHLDIQTPSRTGIETFVAGYSSPVDPPVDPPAPTPSPGLATEQLGYRIDINVNINININ